MKKRLDFKVPFVASWGSLNMILCFAPAYMHIEGLDVSGIKDYPCPPQRSPPASFPDAAWHAG